MIPKIIHYCWLSDDPMPRSSKRYIKGWKKKLPDYEFILWDRKRFDLDSTLWTRQAYDAKKYAFAADYIRLYALYHYGGIYLDTDVEVIRSFNPLLERKFILGFEDPNATAIEAGIMGAEASSGWLFSCLKYYENKPFIIGEKDFDMRPLPKIIMEIINRDYKEYLCHVYTYDYLSAKDWNTRGVCVTENSYSIHHFFSSWRPFKRKMKIRVKGILGVKLFNAINRFRKRK